MIVCYAYGLNQNVHCKVFQSVYYVVVILPDPEVITLHCLTVSVDLHKKTLKTKQTKKTHKE